MRAIDIEIPVIVGSNGKWYASGYETKNEPDWGFLADSLQDDDGNYPAAEKRYLVRATVFVPDEATEVVAGATMSAD